jgi:3-phosphoshikimate 1-carboxyvinyltransferase
LSPGTPSVRLEIRPGRGLAGTFRPPGDKSVTHRALLLGALGSGASVVENANPGLDCAATRSCLERLGVEVRGRERRPELVGRDFALAEPERVLECGNSGTTLRLLAGALAAQPFVSVLQGDASLNHRPVARLIEPLERMGASLWARGGDAYPPLVIRGARLRGIRYDLPVASAQVASCVLIAGLHAEGETVLTVPGPARDHTERMLQSLGVPLDVDPIAGGGRRVRLIGPLGFAGSRFHVPGDPSAAAFFLAAAAATPNARVTAKGVMLNPTRTGILELLERMGAGVERANVRLESGEEVGDVTVTGPAQLGAVDVPPEWLPRLIDEVPAWAVAAARAKGRSLLRGAAELRVKESDRIATLAAGLEEMGIDVREHPDGLEIEGGDVRTGHVEAHGDHRIAMAFACLAATARLPVVIEGAEGIATSYPGFAATLAELGGGVDTRIREPAAT